MTGQEKINTLKNYNNIDKLKRIVEYLRANDGCSWDRKQTHKSLKQTCIEEAAEVVCGINVLEETGSADNLKEELGDLLLQIVFHAVIAEEEGIFTLEDLIDTVCEKMIRRHPHVFNDLYLTEEEMHKLWDKIKKKEKEGKPNLDNYLKDAFNESKDLIDKAINRKGF